MEETLHERTLLGLICGPCEPKHHDCPGFLNSYKCFCPLKLRLDIKHLVLAAPSVCVKVFSSSYDDDNDIVCVDSSRYYNPVAN